MGRNKKDSNIININKLEIESKLEIDYDKLALAIVKAQRIEKELEMREKSETLAQWKSEIGYNNHEDKQGLTRKAFCLCNDIKVIWNVMFISRKKHLETSPTGAFIQGLTSAFFALCQYVLTAVAATFVIALVYHLNTRPGIKEYFMCGSFALISFMLSRIFRLMKIEIEQMSNREQVLGVFAAVMSALPLVEKIAGLFEGVG